jgi:arylsulfatase A-like enzyme
VRFVCTLVGLVLSLISVSDGAADKPNIVFILADDLGSYDVGWRGSEIRTPNLDRLAKSGVTLEQFYVQPVCSPTRAALLTGRYPFRYGFQTGVVRPWAQYGLPLEERLLPQALREAGYETAIVGKWHLGHFQPEYLPTRRGFEHQYGHYNGALDYFTHIRDGGFDWHRDDKVNRDEGYSTDLVGQEAARLVKERDPSRPLFLYIPFNGVHSPYQPPERLAGDYSQFQGQRRKYAAMTTALDEAVGKVVQALTDEKIIDDTLIIFSSDNGGPAPGKTTSNGALRAGKGTVYEGGVRTCAFATWKGNLPAGGAVETPIHITDWYPTLLKIAGAQEEQALPIDGRDILPTLTGKGPSAREEIIINATPNGGAIRVGDWKLVLNGSIEDDEEGGAPKGAARKGEVELFNLKSDLSEKTNLATTEPERVKELKDRYERFAAQAVAPKLKPKPKGFQSPPVWGE